MSSNYSYDADGGLDDSFVEELRGQAVKASIDEIKQMIAVRMDGRQVRTISLTAGTFVYRARKIGGAFSTTRPMSPRDLSYPPADLCSIGRLNRAGSPVLYCSTSKEPLLYELDAVVGDEFVISIWQLEQPAMLNNIGYTQSVFDGLGSSRKAPLWGEASDTAPTSEAVNTIDHLSHLFTEKDQAGNVDRYKITAAIAEIHYGTLEGKQDGIAGVLYPSVASRANGDNLALLPWFVDASVRWVKAIHVRVSEALVVGWVVQEIDTARAVDDIGNLQWAGHPPKIVLDKNGISGTCIFKKGVDEFGDYIHGKDGIIGHWECIDFITGERYLF